MFKTYTADICDQDLLPGFYNPLAPILRMTCILLLTIDGRPPFSKSQPPPKRRNTTMKRKLYLSLTLALIVSALFGSVAFAGDGDTGQPDRPFPRHRRIGLRGEITSVNLADGSFSLQTPRGEDLTLLTDGRTKFRGSVDEFADLAVGMPAAVMALRQDQGRLLALQVLVHDELDRVKRYGGKVAAIDLAGETLTLETPNEGELGFTVDEQTRYQGAVEGFGDLSHGQAVIILGASLDDGSLKALLIFAPKRLPIRRFAGEVAQVDLDQSTFTVLTQRRESVVVRTDQGTEFFSRDGGVDTLADLEAGMKVVASAERQVDGVLLGKRVIVRPAGDQSDKIE
jgi:hypothetical protein